VLVVDDVSGVRESVRIALETAGFEVQVADDGTRALELLTNEEFDAVVLDIWMPKLDGLSVIKRLKQKGSPTRVFVMTGGGPRMTLETASSIAEAWGAEDVFFKPFDEDALVAAIRRPPPAK
jgi:DNA-binding response OmpR family regulator